MDISKQVIVVRKDLNMRKGKMGAQIAHAAMSFITTQLRGQKAIQDEHETGFHAPSVTVAGSRRYVDLTGEQEPWIDGSFTKAVVSVNSEAELLEIYEKAKQAGLTVSLIQDSGRTEFHNVLTYTCVAVGPNRIDKVNNITGHLPLL